MSEQFAQYWIAAWVESTGELEDFRRAPDFWEVAYQFAIEENRRGNFPGERSHQRPRRANVG